MFIKNEKYVHGTLYFDTKDNPVKIYILIKIITILLYIAFTNKKWLKTKVEHQLTAQTDKPSRISFKKYLYSIDPQGSHNE